VTSTAAPPPPAAQPTQQQVSDAMAAAQGLGIDVSRFKDGADLVNTMWSTVQAMNQEIEQYRAMQAQWQQPQQPAAVPPAPPAATAAPEGFKWDVPAFDPSWERFVQRDEATGYFRALAPEHAGIAQKVNEYYQWRNKTADRLLTDFPKLVEQAVASKFASQEQAAREAAQAELRQWQYDQQINAFEERLAPNLYQTDLRGERVLTPWGQQIIQTVKAYMAQGVQDPLWIMQQAERLVGPPPQLGNGQPAQPNTQYPVTGASPGMGHSIPAGAAPVYQPPAQAPQPQPSMLPGTQYRVVPVQTLQLRAPDGRIVSPNELSEQQKATFLQQAQAARATHVPQVATTPADVQSRPVTEADLNSWFLNPSGAAQ
jgi:hypothetical protein